MTAAVTLDTKTFHSRLQRLRSAWKNGNLGECDSIMLTLGQPTDFTVYQKTTAMFSWLLGYEFPETVMILTREDVIFLASQKKGAILEGLASEGNHGIHVIKREKETGRSQEQFERVWSLLKKQQVTSDAAVRVGILGKDKNEGGMVEEWNSWVQSKEGFTGVDVSVDIGGILAEKDDSELKNMRIASQLSSLLMSEQVSKKILGIIDEGKRVTHLQLSDDFESFVTNHIGKFQGRILPGTNLDFVDICYPPIIQSGGNYSLKPSAVSSEERMSEEGAIVCSVGLRYRAYCANIARTLLIDPSPEQEATLEFLNSLQQFLATKLVPGAVLSNVFQAGVEYVRERKPELERHLVSNFGFGIGLEFRQPEYLINARCERCIENGMTFNLMVGLQDLNINGKVYALMVADTVQVLVNGAKFLTEGLHQLKEVSYSLKGAKNSNKRVHLREEGPTIKTRLRSQTAGGSADESAAKRRREHQKDLGQQRIREGLERYGNSESSDATAKKAQVVKFESYRKETLLPKDFTSLKISFDKRAETVILPLFGRATPFHINTIKNVTKNDEGDYSFLRINFNSPGRSFGKKDATSVNPFAEPNAHFVRGITLRTADVYRAQEIFKDIQEMKKQAAEREAVRKERADLVEQGQLVEVTGRRPIRLTDIYVRPGLEGKRLPGDVEIHSNGIRYRSQLKADQKIEVLFANVKHFFFQPCDHETIVLLHLHLHHPIMVGKKKTRDVQFYREALESVVDETTGGGRRTKMRFGDEDEIAQEQEERKRRAAANEEFRSFAEKIVDASRNTLEVDVPFRDLGFSGVPGRQNVLLQPTTDCLVHLVEPPFMIVTLADVEVAFLERVVFGLKNFDLVFIFKDHSQAPVHINSIPMTQLEAVKDWLDSVDVYFVESKVNFNWTNIMKTVNEDPIGFYEMGGWTYLQPDETAAGATDEEDEGSSEYEPEEEDEEEFESASDEDDVEEEDEEDEEEYSESDDEGDDSEGDDNSDESDAPDWDELEEQARKQDERSRSSASLAASAKSKRPAPPSNSRNAAPPSKRR